MSLEQRIEQLTNAINRLTERLQPVEAPAAAAAPSKPEAEPEPKPTKASRKKPEPTPEPKPTPEPEPTPEPDLQVTEKDDELDEPTVRKALVAYQQKHGSKAAREVLEKVCGTTKFPEVDAEQYSALYEAITE